jgi:hypothetical protein
MFLHLIGLMIGLMGIFFLSQGFQLKILDIYQEPVPMPVI